MTPRTAVDLGLMQGAPPPAERLVTPDNWIEGPYNRWGFLHVRELARTARISRGDGPVRALESDPLDLGSVPVAFDGDTVPFGEALARGYTDAICIVHDGRIVFEHYVDGMRPDDTHLLMSVSKSLTATLVGVLVGDGVLDPAAEVSAYVAALRGTAWEGCTLQHLLDMRAGTRFDEEDYLDPDSDGVLLEEVCGYRPRRRTDLPAANTYEWIAKLDNARPHGGPFEYRSILTDVLAWCAVEATGTRFPDLFSRLVWSRIGAERDADIIVDEAGFPVVEGGICTTVRDLARFGLMHLADGAAGGEQVVPAAWIGRLLEPEAELIAAFDSDHLADHPRAFYHDQWWIWDAAAGIYSGYGINGQQLLVHRPTRTVIARLSTWPERWDDRLSRYADVAEPRRPRAARRRSARLNSRAMYHVRRADEIDFDVPKAYAPHSSGHRRAGIVTQAVGAVHTGITQCALDPGGTVGEHLHSFEKSFYVLEGRPQLTLDGRTWQLSPDDCGLVPLGAPHAWRNAGGEPCRWIEASAPTPRPEGHPSPDTFFTGAPAPDDEPGTLDIRDPRARTFFRLEPGQMELDNLRIGAPVDAPTVSASMATALLAYSGIALKMLVDPRLGAVLHQLFMVEYEPGGAAQLHDHPLEESYTIISGEVDAEADGERFTLHEGDVFWTGVGCVHGFWNTSGGRVRFLETQSPQLPANHSYRFNRDWDYLTERLGGTP